LEISIPTKISLPVSRVSSEGTLIDFLQFLALPCNIRALMALATVRATIIVDVVTQAYKRVLLTEGGSVYHAVWMSF
jgi:hypothetical protein